MAIEGSASVAPVPFSGHAILLLFANCRPASFSVTYASSSAARRCAVVCLGLVVRHVGCLSAGQKSWRRLDGHNQSPKVAFVAKFTDGLEVASADSERKAAA